MQSALAPKLRDVIASHIAEASPDEIAQVVGSLCGNGKVTIHNTISIDARAERQRFVKIGDTGGVVLGSNPFVAVLDNQTGLTWSRDKITRKGVNFEKAQQACADLRLCGHADWRLPTVQELLTLVDYSRHGPSIDTGLFDCESSWYWTSTPAAANPAGAAWFVDFSYGDSDWGFHDGDYFVRAVRSGQ